jgi:hypothetical protein
MKKEQPKRNLLITHTLTFPKKIGFIHLFYMLTVFQRLYHSEQSMIKISQKN